MLIIIGTVATFAACVVGGVVGFATSLLLLPVLLMIGVPLVEAVSLCLLLAVVTRLPTMVMLRRGVDRRRTSLMLIGALPGVVAGLWVVRTVPATALQVVAGVVVLLSGCYLWWARRVRVAMGVGTGATLLAGATSGLLGVTTSLNGVPPAILLAQSGAAVRTRLADLSVFFVVSDLVILVVLGHGTGTAVLAGPVSWLWLAAGLAGNFVGLHVSRHITPHRFDSMTVLLVVLSGAASLVTAATG